MTEPSQERLTMTNCLQAILNNVEEKGEKSNESNDIDAKYDYVTTKLDITRNQAEMLAAVLEICIGGIATVSRLSEKLMISNLEFLSRMTDLDVLIDKRYIRTSSSSVTNGEAIYYVPSEVITSLRKDKVPSLECYENLSVESMARKWNKIFQEYSRRKSNSYILFRDVLDVVRFNKQSEFKKAWDELSIEQFEDGDKVLLIYMIMYNVYDSENSFEWGDVARFFEDYEDEIFLKREIERGKHKFFEMGLIEFENSDGMIDGSTFKLTDECMKKFVGKVIRPDEDLECCGNVVRSASISPKQLFYNEEEGSQISRLSSLLQKENFDKVVERLGQKGLRKGFCALLYGGPGTGKTETVYQIARETGRDLFIVDVSELKNMYVGESEKKVRKLFQEYKSIVRSKGLAPILLFNEADAILGIRMEGASKAVDRMENSIQNIILQEMESLEGIMIATTNLTGNLDKAFERRFLIKVNLSKPSVEARSRGCQGSRQ